MLIPIYVKLLNCIFDSGKVPDTWLWGNIIPLFTNKGKSDEPKNYRPISILSCLGKLFTMILNKRLNAYSDEFLLINESQVGFRQGYSTNEKYIFFVLIIWTFNLEKEKNVLCIHRFWKSLRYWLERGFMGVNYSWIILMVKCTM